MINFFSNNLSINNKKKNTVKSFISIFLNLNYLKYKHILLSHNKIFSFFF